MGIDRVTKRAVTLRRQVAQQVQVVDRPFDHQRIGNVVAELTPLAAIARSTGEPADQVVQFTISPAPHDVAQRRDVATKAMAHRHAHLLAGQGNLLCDAYGRFHRIGDRFLRKNVAVMRQRDVNDRLVRRRRYDDNRKVGLILVKRAVDIGVTLALGQTQSLTCVRKLLGYDVDGRNGLDQPVRDVRRQRGGAPGAAHAAGTDLDEFAWHRDFNSSCFTNTEFDISNSLGTRAMGDFVFTPGPSAAAPGRACGSKGALGAFAPSWSSLNKHY